MIDTVIHYGMIIWVTTAVLTALAGSRVQQIAFGSVMEFWCLKDGASLTTYQKFFKQFQLDEIEVIGVSSEDILLLNLAQ